MVHIEANNINVWCVQLLESSDHDSAGASLSDSREVGQMSASEIPVLEIEMDLSHFQHLVQTSAAGFAPDVTPHPVTLTLTDAAGSPSVFPFTEVIDLSTSASEQCPGEKTPGPYGEVPGFLLDIARGCSTVPCPKTSVHSHNRAGSTARVCLEKRFKILSADPSNYQEIRFLAKQQPPEAQIQPWSNLDRPNTIEVSSPFVLGVFNPVANVCDQMMGHLPHLPEQKQQTKTSPFDHDSETSANKPQHLNGSGSAREQHAIDTETSRSHRRDDSPQPVTAMETTQDCSEGSGSSSERRGRSRNAGCRKERHNLMERERRRRIRVYCDELNVLVPLCHAKCDKVTTLQLTTAYLRYIHKMHGDTFREEFQKMVSQGKELTLELGLSSLQEISAVEQ
ncbi:uncharacterized protein isoform X1 [Takifugu rubripes]|uniref:uncharacterized protein isoform X1 n=2 Tax=Takifugu rubripes TaxID=31033 RepID=UPI0011458D5E|nr:transcription factor-like 5 protein isoform X1 [Takifugu rubripes]